MAGVCRRWGVCGQIAHLPWLNNGWMVIHKQTRGKISFNQNENSTEQGIANLVVNRCHGSVKSCRHSYLYHFGPIPDTIESTVAAPETEKHFM